MGRDPVHRPRGGRPRHGDGAAARRNDTGSRCRRVHRTGRGRPGVAGSAGRGPDRAGRPVHGRPVSGTAAQARGAHRPHGVGAQRPGAAQPRSGGGEHRRRDPAGRDAPRFVGPGPARPGARRGRQRPGLASRRTVPAHSERADRAADRPQSAPSRRAHRVVARGQLQPSRPDDAVRPLQPRHRHLFRQASAGRPRAEGQGVPPGGPRAARQPDAAPGRRRVEDGRPARGGGVAATPQEPVEPARRPLDRHGGLLLLGPAGQRRAGPLAGRLFLPRTVRRRSALGRRPVPGTAPGERHQAHRPAVPRPPGGFHLPGRPGAGAVHRRERAAVVVGHQPSGARRGRAGPAGGDGRVHG